MNILLKNTLLVLGLLWAASYSVAQQAPKAQSPVVRTVEIKTSAQCEMCNDRISKAVLFSKGVQNAQLNLETQVITIKYHSKKTSPEALRQILSRLGYDADEVQADPVAYSKLPACCQKGGHAH